jgi:hypothetical protein
MSGVGPRQGWWRENRFWLPALPVALAAVLLASSYQLKTFWYDEGLHDKVASAPQGEYAAVSLDYRDAVGPTSRTFRVKLKLVATTRDYPFNDVEGPREPPEDVDAVVVHLGWDASPDQVLRGCQVTLVDSEGRHYERLPGDGQGNLCVRSGMEGPVQPLLEGEQRTVPEGADRPPTWSTAPVFLVPEGRRITQVLVWWERPRYVELSAS